MQISSWTDIGRVRKNNEDSLLVMPPWKDPGLSSRICCLAVADGMGGHVGGEVASRLAVSTVRRWVARQTPETLTPDAVETAFAEANQAVWDHVKSHPELSGMGTTLTAAVITGKRAFIGHVGDTRLYLLRQGNLKLITHDHTLVAEQVRLGHLTPEAAKKHPARHILSRAMGVKEFIKVDAQVLDLQPGDILFICSDGISGVISDEVIKKGLSGTFPGPVQGLIRKALAAGGPDNATGVAIRLDEIPWEVPGRFSLQRLKLVWAHRGEITG